MHMPSTPPPTVTSVPPDIKKKRKAIQTTLTSAEKQTERDRYDRESFGRFIKNIENCFNNPVSSSGSNSGSSSGYSSDANSGYGSDDSALDALWNTNLNPNKRQRTSK